MSALPLAELRDSLEDAVRAAGEAIGEIVAGGRMRVGMKWGEGPVSEADHAADDVLHARLMPLIEGAQWLSEESEQSDPLVPGEPTWVVDPLDGTREFLLGLPEFGVSVGLFEGGRLTLGAVALPPAAGGTDAGEWTVLSGLLDGDRTAARRDGAALPPIEDDPDVGRIVVSRHDYEWRRLQYHIPFEVYPAGSSVLKLSQVALGEAGVYLSTRPRSVWDVAGGAAVVEACGGALLDARGEPLRLSPQQIRIPPFAAAAPQRALALLRAIGAGPQ